MESGMASRMKVALLVLAATGGIALGLSQGPLASPAEAATVSRNATLEDLAQQLTERFVDPAVARQYAAMLRANAASGKYAAMGDDAAFAQAVTDDLQAVHFDGHLKLLLPDGAPATPSPRGPIEDSQTVEATARLTPDIAYIRLGDFLNQEGAIPAIRKFLADNADAKTLIFDVRTHRGGGLAEMDVMFPMIFDKPQVLVGMDTRANVASPLNDSTTLHRVPGPDGVVRREHRVIPAAPIGNLQKVKIFVLASGRTASAGEHFVLAMKRTHRATIIGETTYGAGNFGGGVPVDGGFSAWIPVGRTFDPDTNKGWDYFGIAPDVPVPVEQALVEALVRSGLPKAQAEKLSAANGPPADRISSLRKAPASVAGI
jgi:hypothetical protein